MPDEIQGAPTPDAEGPLTPPEETSPPAATPTAEAASSPTSATPAEGAAARRSIAERLEELFAEDPKYRDEFAGMRGSELERERRRAVAEHIRQQQEQEQRNYARWLQEQQQAEALLRAQEDAETRRLTQARDPYALEEHIAKVQQRRDAFEASQRQASSLQRMQYEREQIQRGAVETYHRQVVEGIRRHMAGLPREVTKDLWSKTYAETTPEEQFAAYMKDITDAVIRRERENADRRVEAAVAKIKAQYHINEESLDLGTGQPGGASFQSREEAEAAYLEGKITSDEYIALVAGGLSYRPRRAA